MLSTRVCDLLGIKYPIIQVGMEWKQAILAAESQDTIKVEFWKELFPIGDHAYQTIPRTLNSTFIRELQNQPDTVKQDAQRLRDIVGSSIAQGSFGELFPFTGQTTGLIKEILPAAEIVRRLVDEAEATIRQTAGLSK